MTVCWSASPVGLFLGVELHCSRRLRIELRSSVEYSLGAFEPVRLAVKRHA